MELWGLNTSHTSTILVLSQPYIDTLILCFNWYAMAFNIIIECALNIVLSQG